jgi:N12 class adenine-specific DNA methylase
MNQLALQLDALPIQAIKPVPPRPQPPATAPIVPIATGEKAKARDIIAAIRTLKLIEDEQRSARPEERQVLARFCGLGPVALSIFPDPIRGTYKQGWEDLGEQLRRLLTQEEYDSAKRTTFNAFFTSSTVIRSMFQALHRLGVPDTTLVLEPGCGPGRFPLLAPAGMRFIGVELDSISGRIARALHLQADIRIEDFHSTKLPEGKIDAVIGNVPFADIKLEHRGQKFSLHDYFFAKSVDSLKPGGVLALVTSHFTMDKVNASIREYLASKADFLGAIRLPSDAFKREGTNVVTDIVLLRKRSPGEAPHHADPEWLGVAPLAIDAIEVPINRYFLNHPEMVLGTWSRKDTLYGEGFSVTGNGDLAEQLREAVARLPAYVQKSPQIERDGRTSSNSDHVVAPAFVPPPPERHIAEGSFFVADDRTIRQVIDGQAEPVAFGGTALTAYGTMTGKRLAALIGLRDRARRVLQSQNEGWPEVARNDARRELNWAYDRFAATYGPVNKTTFSEGKDGGLIRRMPNLVKFREDPDAMLVMSLEDYDEVTAKATKAAIMKRDVVGKKPPITSVRSAEEGLLVSLNQRGAVDMPFISQLYGKPEEQVVAELGDLIYRDPESKTWQTADAYLSGNVRAKLAQAEAAGAEYARNAEALRAVQPEDVLPGDIDCNLGSPWVPESDIRNFAAHLFGVEPDSISIAHLKKDALWSVDAGYSAEQSVAAKSEYGTARANGTMLLELALNMRTPVIYDPDPADPDKRVVNQNETLAAKEKQRAIKEKFKQWIFTDPDRTERLVRLYNDTYNNLRPRLFDGSHLDFPGMNAAIILRQHQKDAVWRMMSGGNTLLAHAVGAGKTNICAAATMKMRQAGIARKCMIVTPNHMLEQFAREFQQLYPNARLLVASKEDFTRERRKLLTAKIASGDWDAIIVTHSSFERIGMSRDHQERFLNEQIAEYNQLLLDAGNKGAARSARNIIKTIEKQKAAREAKLKDLLAEDKKDDGLVFDELGIDYLIVDEQHMSFKNLETPTKMDRVAGIQTGGSERAFDLYMKCRYLHEKHPGHGITFATGTPISNTMVEMYTEQRFLDPDGLKDRGIDHFDAWAATFGEVVDTMEISPDGKTLKPRSRFAKFVNLPELQMMFRSFADVQTADMLNLPRPKLETGKPIVVACPMSDEQHALQDELVKRYERLRSCKVDPREDNALAITTDGRKLALDARMLSASAPDFPGSKVNALVENVTRIWRDTADRRGTQMIFCDMGVHLTPSGYSAYDDVIGKLEAAGIPRSQIAAIGDADSDAKKRALFDQVRSGQVRVLIGSTTKMGTGTNVQKRLVALHHLDAPWKPAEVEQREGRIRRQGNENPEVAIYRYVTTGSFDSFMWQCLETKARFINQVMAGDGVGRKAEDIGGQELDYATVKSIASGNPAFMTLAEADAEIQRLKILERSHADEQYLARRARKELPERIDRLTERVAGLTADQATMKAHEEITIGGRETGDPVAALGRALDALPLVMQTRRIPLGSYHGLAFGIIEHPQWTPEVYLEGAVTRKDTLSREHQGPRAVLNAVERLARGYRVECERTQQDLELARRQQQDYSARVGQPFQHAAYLDQLATLRDQLKAGLSGAERKEGEPTVAELAEKIKVLRAGQVIEATPERSAKRQVSAEEPVTARIRRRVETSDEPGPPWALTKASEITHQERVASARQRQNCQQTTL